MFLILRCENIQWIRKMKPLRTGFTSSKNTWAYSIKIKASILRISVPSYLKCFYFETDLISCWRWCQAAHSSRLIMQWGAAETHTSHVISHFTSGTFELMIQFKSQNLLISLHNNTSLNLETEEISSSVSRKVHFSPVFTFEAALMSSCYFKNINFINLLKLQILEDVSVTH